MFRYYTVIIFISIAAMMIIQVSIHKSWTLSKRKKLLFHLLFLNIAIAAFCEWMGVWLQGSGGQTRILHIVIKAIELSVAPSIGLLIAWVIENRKMKAALILLGAHALLECLSGVFGFIYSVDANSVYTHAEFYWIYMLAYLLSIAYTMYVIIRNTNRYQYNGIAYFYLVVDFMIAGIIIQSIDSNLKVDYVVLAVASLMIYIFTLEMIQQTDQLTELLNRRGYENYISHLDEKCVIIFFDIDKFKSINDQYGHSFGDFCISKTGKAIKRTYAKYGKCFRFGGDEFCVVLTKNLTEAENLNARFVDALAKMREEEQRLPSVSMGYAYFDPENHNIVDTIQEADQMMYKYKSEHASAAK